MAPLTMKGSSVPSSIPGHDDTPVAWAHPDMGIVVGATAEVDGKDGARSPARHWRQAAYELVDGKTTAVLAVLPPSASEALSLAGDRDEAIGGHRPDVATVEMTAPQMDLGGPGPTVPEHPSKSGHQFLSSGPTRSSLCLAS